MSLQFLLICTLTLGHQSPFLQQWSARSSCPPWFQCCKVSVPASHAKELSSQVRPPLPPPPPPPAESESESNSSDSANSNYGIQHPNTSHPLLYFSVAAATRVGAFGETVWAQGHWKVAIRSPVVALEGFASSALATRKHEQAWNIMKQMYVCVVYILYIAKRKKSPDVRCQQWFRVDLLTTVYTWFATVHRYSFVGSMNWQLKLGDMHFHLMAHIRFLESSRIHVSTSQLSIHFQYGRTKGRSCLCSIFCEEPLLFALLSIAVFLPSLLLESLI